MASELTRVQYAGLDFNTHEDDLRTQIQINFATIYNDYAVSSPGIMLLDLVSYGLDTLSFYVDRRTTDQYLVCARTPKAVARIARQLGYRIRGAVASSVDLEITSPAGVPYPFTLPTGFQLLGPNSLILEVASDVVFAAAGTQTVSCYEGETVVDTFVSDGTPNQRFVLGRVPSGKYVADGSIRIKVDGAPWDEHEFLDFYKSNIFESMPAVLPPTVSFGDGVAGNIPPTGASVVVTYVATSGRGGQVLQNTITSVKTPLVVAFASITLVVNNPGPAVGGDNPETTEHAKICAAKVYKSRKAAVTREDYEALASSYADPLFGRVAVSQALCPRSAGADLPLMSSLAAIESLLGSVQASVQAAADVAAIADAAIADQLSVVVQPSLTDLAFKAATVVSGVDSARAQLVLISGDVLTIQGDSSAVQTELATLRGEIYGLPATTLLTPAQKDAFYARIDVALGRSAHVNTISTQVDSARGTADTALLAARQQVINPLDPVDEIGTALTEGLLLTLSDASAEITAQLVVSAASWATVQTYVLDRSLSVEAYTQAIYDHVDAFLSADCKANLVVVPILTKDAGGFYTAPTLGLIKSLQAYLDARKEVSQTVAVTSGEDALVEVSMRVLIGVRSGSSLDRSVITVETVLDSLLRGRSFGDDLYLLDAYDALKTVPGLGYATIVALTTDPTGYVDASPVGNVIIPGNDKVLTKGVIEVVPVQLDW